MGGKGQLEESNLSRGRESGQRPLAPDNEEEAALSQVQDVEGQRWEAQLETLARSHVR